MDRVELTEMLEKAHKTNLERLLCEFGDKRKEEICALYHRCRLSDEKTAKVKDFIPIIVYRTVRETLKTDERYA